MILNDVQIVEAVRSAGSITIDPFDEDCVEPASYDLYIGEEGITTSSKKIVNIRESGFLLMEPGDFGIVLSLEILKTDAQHVARIGLTSTYARKGLVATIGPQLDPGYHGRLFVHLYNLSPRRVTLPYKDKFLTLEFHRLEAPARNPYKGPHQGRVNLGPEEIKAVTEAEAMPLAEVLTSLRSLTQNVGSMTKDVDNLTNNVREFLTSVGQLTGRMDNLATQFAGVTGEMKNSSIQLTAQFNTLAKDFADVGGQLKGSRWLIPLMFGLVIAIASIVVSMMLKR